MTDTLMQAMELGGKGYSCAQIVLFTGLRYMGRENPDLIRAASALAQGGGCSGELCGALSGGLCLLGLYLGKGQDSEQASADEIIIYADLIEWFRERHSVENMITCDAIMSVKNGACQMNPGICIAMVSDVIDKCVQNLLAKGIDPSEGRELPACL